MSGKGKKKLHQRNRNLEQYDLESLIILEPELKRYCFNNESGKTSIDFSKPQAIILLNRAILNHYYNIKYWEFPVENLCPPIPGRADYLHYVADLLSKDFENKVPIKVRCLDIGVGASCIYPILGTIEYAWKFIGSDIDPQAIASAKKIISNNPQLINNIELRLQTHPQELLKGILTDKDHVDFCMCNPPFHASLKEAEKATRRKNKNLHGIKHKEQSKNFSGNLNELIFEGGEIAFISQLILESKQYESAICWFTCLVSKEENLQKIYSNLEEQAVSQFETIEMATRNKKSRIIAWTYLSESERKNWALKHWNH